MALNESEILRILELFDQSDWNEIRLQSGDIKLAVSKTGQLSGFDDRPVAPAPVQRSRPPSPAAPSVPQNQPAAESAVAAADPNWVAVNAPLLGTFYAAPKPGALAFVKVGQSVKPEDTVCSPEVMNLMNHVEAGVAGKIARIDARNGELSEFDQVLMYIDPT